MSMAAMAFGAPRRSARGGIISRLSHGALRVGGRRPAVHHHKKKRRQKAPAHHGSRGVRLSNEFLKTVLLMNVVRGLMHQ
jgi:hypothetical protein